MQAVAHTTLNILVLAALVDHRSSNLETQMITKELLHLFDSEQLGMESRRLSELVDATILDFTKQGLNKNPVATQRALDEIEKLSKADSESAFNAAKRVVESLKVADAQGRVDEHNFILSLMHAIHK
ncbi:MAG: hypothetical protein ACH34X_14035 [Thiolinea sp.]|jgi:hypothetical protein